MKMILSLFILLPFLIQASEECNNIQSSQQVYLCSKKSLEDSDAELNYIYKEILLNVGKEYISHSELKTEYINKIKLSQRAWIDFRDKNCEVFSFQIDPKTQAYETSMNSCRNDITRKRIAELNAMLEQ
ncbi:TPA: DUF1311 domain-containing protein [Enterobacter soli]|uniref:Lysozyme inhibitor LprI family protein n=1 Tax=Enterobacter soli TaxID=885040 RepID=A0AAW8HAK0_9ENTR|nr:lysozyme inhibitor LprI family protein [Enterobacter soli]MDQ2256484.1 lysozyme inhibitor LprI family protein [Enterobacter soli]MDQ2335701.1 lysozyme inhibitor LprI family protein [Enterobacter soli]HEE9789253.1 DUF1311 domain-containing protein [Enterobacter soli]